MHSSVIIFLLALVACSAAQETYFELANDSDYPQHVVIKDVQYNIMPSEYVDINCTVVIYEELDVGTNVKMSISPNFPYAKLLNNIDVNLGIFCRKEMPVYNQFREASNGQLPERLPIAPGIYRIENMRLSTDKFPKLWRGFDAQASFIVHKNGRILSKLDARAALSCPDRK